MNREFKLEKVLDFREKILEKEKIKLKNLINEHRKLIISLERVKEDIKLKKNEQNHNLNSGILELNDMYNKYIQLLEIDQSSIDIKIKDLEVIIDNQKVVVTKALRDFKVMEKLKDKHKIDYIKYINKMEVAQIDEINIIRGFNNEKDF